MSFNRCLAKTLHDDFGSATTTDDDLAAAPYAEQRAQSAIRVAWHSNKSVRLRRVEEVRGEAAQRNRCSPSAFAYGTGTVTFFAGSFADESRLVGSPLVVRRQPLYLDLFGFLHRLGEVVGRL